MDPKEIRNVMISLAVLGAGIWLVINITKSYTKVTSLPGIPEGLTNSLDSLGILFLYALAVIEALLFLAWLYARKAGTFSGKRNTAPLRPESPPVPRRF